ncbi:hypothetical protein FHS29_000205 [Saccharothrix tamanrassetensis]|uniref:PknH-like extracellular domain-containing protein n=1 Tax=Saccharothrix tamanrassetensis TaxID=1051531 RepID=A0A841CC99_9PSEU|nr:hypothetical protein [Saccharothrix tamanrassetensis]MBB5953635.1 hypothetical protein [Saccharothrix tamanrassetensis]
MTTSSAPSLIDRLPALVERAAIPRDGLTDYGVAAPTDQRYAVSGMPKPCAAKVDGESGYTPGLFREWDGGRIALRQTVVGYSEATGAEVLSRLTAATRDCAEWADGDRQVRITQSESVERPTGVDGFLGFCTSVRKPDQVYWMCAAFLARGNLVSCVYTFRGDGPQGALDDLHAILPRAVDRLVNA